MSCRRRRAITSKPRRARCFPRLPPLASIHCQSMKRPEAFHLRCSKAAAPSRSAIDNSCGHVRSLGRADTSYRPRAPVPNKWRRHNSYTPTGVPEPDAAARFAAQRAFIAADNSARRSAEIPGLRALFRLGRFLRLSTCGRLFGFLRFLLRPSARQPETNFRQFPGVLLNSLDQTADLFA